jgi:mRNA-degrading endonuclease RelE of RelBE toxin-antitoxin system
MDVIFLRQFSKDIDKLPTSIRKKLTRVIIEAEDAENLSAVQHCKKLHNHNTAYRIRMGDYRLGFYFENNQIIMARVVHRKDIYKLFP